MYCTRFRLEVTKDGDEEDGLASALPLPAHHFAMGLGEADQSLGRYDLVPGILRSVESFLL